MKSQELHKFIHSYITTYKLNEKSTNYKPHFERFISAYADHFGVDISLLTLHTHTVFLRDEDEKRRNGEEDKLAIPFAVLLEGIEIRKLNDKMVENYWAKATFTMKPKFSAKQIIIGIIVVIVVSAFLGLLALFT